MPFELGRSNRPAVPDEAASAKAGVQSKNRRIRAFSYKASLMPFDKLRMSEFEKLVHQFMLNSIIFYSRLMRVELILKMPSPTEFKRRQGINHG